MPVVLLQRFPARTALLSLNLYGACWPSVLTLVHLSLACVTTEGNSGSPKTPTMLDVDCKYSISRMFDILCVYIGQVTIGNTFYFKKSFFKSC